MAELTMDADRVKPCPLCGVVLKEGDTVCSHANDLSDETLYHVLCVKKLGETFGLRLRFREPTAPKVNA